MRRFSRIAAAVVVAAVAWGCATAPGPRVATPPASAERAPAGRLAGTEWVTAALGTDGFAPPPLTLAFEDGTFSGYGGCNWLGGRYAAEGVTLRLGPTESTARGCADAAAAEREARFVHALASARRVHLAGDTLRLRDRDGAALLSLVRLRLPDVDPAALVGTRWRLVFRGNRAPPPDARITLAFGRGSVEGDAGCRGYSGTYVLRGARMGVTSLAMRGTECADTARLREEGELTAALSEIRHVEFRDGMLLLHPVSGRTLRFVRDAPAPPPGPTVVLDRAEYPLAPVPDHPHQWVIRVVATFTNRSADPVIPAPCGYHPPSVFLEKQVDGRWVPGYDRACELPRPCTLPALSPGASRTDTLTFSDYGHSNTSKGFVLDPITGTYRLTYHVFSHYSGCEGPVTDRLAPPAASRSAPFRVRDPR